MASSKEQLEIDGHRISVSNLDRVLFPGGRFTKAKVIDYYIRISSYLLPHLKNRPVTLKRFPEGIYGEFFYEKDAPAFTPKWVKTFPVPRRDRSAPDIRYILINDLPTLVWLANLANLEIHPFLHRVPRLTQPTWVVFDLDPGEGADILTCVRVAFRLRETLKTLGLESLAKVSGSKGLQVYVPLNTSITYEQSQPFAKAIADLLAQREPKLIVSEMSKAVRKNRVFIDWSQNTDFKTTVSVYSIRAKWHRPYVSLPLDWNELERAVHDNDADSLYFDPDLVLVRTEKLGDLFKRVLTLKQNLPSELIRHRSLNSITKRHRSTKKSATLSMRSSRQGGRRRFLIKRHATDAYELHLEMVDALRSWRLSGNLTKSTQIKWRAKPMEAISNRDFESATANSDQRSVTWDYGPYELIEGSYEKDFFRLFFSGKKIKGEWTLAREAGAWVLSRSRVEEAKRTKAKAAVHKKRRTSTATSRD